MCPQITCLRRGIVTLITFVFSTVCLFKGHNRIQRHIFGCIGLNFLQCVFSNMSQCISQMIPQILFLRESPKIAFYSGISNDTSKRFSMRERTVATIKADHLKMHMMVHSGEKPFVCKQCNYSCTTASILKRHMLTHSGEKPFVCTLLHNSWLPQGAFANPFRRKDF